MDQVEILKVKYKSSPNIAWVKYWGKFDQEYILPINDSLGITLSSDDIYTQTVITFSKQIPEDIIILNNINHPISKRISKMFELVKSRAYSAKYCKSMSRQDWDLYHFKVQSVNSFPTASGMASSASGLACLAVALNGLFGGIMSQVELSELARLGSGSASRSVYGGLVRWKGVNSAVLLNKTKAQPSLLQKLSKQCISFTAVEPEQLRNIRVLILLANNKQKQVSSTNGMLNSVRTSQLIQYRNAIAYRRIQQILQCLNQLKSPISQQKEVQTYNKIMKNIIKDSNQFHAICLDTYPPIFYLDQFSKQIIYIVDHLLNPILKYRIAYTFDAGPHAFLFVHEKHQSLILKYFYQLFQVNQNSLNSRAKSILKDSQGICLHEYKFRKYQGKIIKPYEIWSTSVGNRAHKIQ